MNLAAISKGGKGAIQPLLSSWEGDQHPCGMSLLPHGKWVLGRPWRCFDAKGTSFQCAWALGLCWSAGRAVIRQTRFPYLKGLCLWGVWCLLISPALEGLSWVLGRKSPENSRGVEQSSWSGKAGVGSSGAGGAGGGFVATALLCAQSWGFWNYPSMGWDLHLSELTDSAPSSAPVWVE